MGTTTNYQPVMVVWVHPSTHECVASVTPQPESGVVEQYGVDVPPTMCVNSSESRFLRVTFFISSFFFTCNPPCEMVLLLLFDRHL